MAEPQTKEATKDIQINLKNDYSKDGIKKLTSLAFILVIINIILLAFIALQYKSKPTEQHFILNEKRLFPLKSLSVPNVSTNTILTWAARAATDTYTYDFSNYTKKISELKQYYTDDGYASLLKALKSSGNFEEIKEAKLVVSSVPKRVPTIISEAKKDGKHIWLVEIPLLIAYKNASSQKQNTILLQLLITRVPTELSATGIGISQIKILPGT